MEHKCESAAPARPDYVGRHRLFRRIPYGDGCGLAPVVVDGNPNYVPRHYLSPLTAALRAAALRAAPKIIEPILMTLPDNLDRAPVRPWRP